MNAVVGDCTRVRICYSTVFSPNCCAEPHSVPLLLCVCPTLSPAGKAASLKAAVAAGKADPAVVVNDAVSQLKANAAALKKTAAGKNPDAAAAIDAAVSGFEAKAEALKSAVASGKADASLALDETLSSLASKADKLKQLAASADMDNAVNQKAGGRLDQGEGGREGGVWGTGRQAGSTCSVRSDVGHHHHRHWNVAIIQAACRCVSEHRSTLQQRSLILCPLRSPSLGKLQSLKTSAVAGSPLDAAAALQSLLSELGQKVAKSVTMLGGSSSPAAAALQAAVAPLLATAASAQAALSSPDAAAGSGADISALINS